MAYDSPVVEIIEALSTPAWNTSAQRVRVVRGVPKRVLSATVCLHGAETCKAATHAVQEIHPTNRCQRTTTEKRTKSVLIFYNGK